MSLNFAYLTQKGTTYYRSLLFLCTFTLTIFSTVIVGSVQADLAKTTSLETTWYHQRMNLDCAGRPLTEILDEVADFFETELVYQAEESGLAIQCSYSQATVSEILNRLFQAQSRAILIENLPERRITVEVFGLSERHVVSTGEGSGKETLPFLGGMTKAELAAMQHAQLELYHQEMKNPSAIIPGLSITRGELEYLHREQNLGYRKLVGDPNQRVAGMSMTLQELEESHEQQLLRYEEKKWSQDVKDPLTGLIPAEIKELHQRQIEASRLE